jgi:predicted Na+-dependent transporter
MVFLSFGMIRGIFVIVGFFLALNPPFSVVGGLLSLLCAITVPIVVGQVWKNRSNTYWTGVSVGLIALFIILVIWALLAGAWWEEVGTEPGLLGLPAYNEKKKNAVEET